MLCRYENDDDRRRLRLARPLKVDRLAIVGRRDPHISNQHVRQTPESTFSNPLSKRQGLSNNLTEGGIYAAAAKTRSVVNHVFSDNARWAVDAEKWSGLSRLTSVIARKVGRF